MFHLKVQFDYPKHMRWLKPIVQREFGDFLERAAEGQRAAYGRQYVLDDAIASGESFKAFDIGDLKARGDRMSITLAPQGDRARVISFIEFGRGPGRMPPRELIIEWLEDRKIIQKGQRDTKVSALSFAIAKMIGEDGIEPRFILEKAQKHYKPYIARMFEATVRRLAAQINEHIDAQYKISNGKR
jgi:hypothetical protein